MKRKRGQMNLSKISPVLTDLPAVYSRGTGCKLGQGRPYALGKANNPMDVPEFHILLSQDGVRLCSLGDISTEIQKIDCICLCLSMCRNYSTQSRKALYSNGSYVGEP